MKDSLIIIQARLSSTRLPGKVLRPFCGGKCLLDLQLKNLLNLDIPIVLATTTNGVDDRLAEWGKVNNVDVFRGEEENVLSRFVSCAEQYNAELLIRVCSDNPFLQTECIPSLLSSLNNGMDYASFSDRGMIPAIRKHWGLFPEGVRLATLDRAQELLLNHQNRSFYEEHVTNFIYGHSKEFNLDLIPAPSEVIDREDLRFTIDTMGDFKNMEIVIGESNKGGLPSLKHLIDFVDRHPRILAVMKKGIEGFTK